MRNSEFLIKVKMQDEDNIRRISENVTGSSMNGKIKKEEKNLP